MPSNTLDRLADRLGGWEAIEARVRAWEREKHTPLVGLEALADYMQQKPETMLRWHRDHAFPMHQDRAGAWVTTHAAIEDWCHHVETEMQRAYPSCGYVA